MALHHTLRELITQIGPAVLEDADGLRGALDDYLPEREAAPAEINTIVRAVRHGAIQRLLNLLDHHAETGAAVADAGRSLAEQSGSDELGARWAVAALGYALGRVDEPTVIASYQDYRARHAAHEAMLPPADPDPSRPDLPTSPPPVTPAPTPPRPVNLAETAPTPGTARQPDGLQPASSSAPSREEQGSRGRVWASLLVVLLVVVAGGAAWLTLQDGDADDPATARDPSSARSNDAGDPTTPDPTSPTADTGSGGGPVGGETPSSYVAVASRSGGSSRIRVVDTVTGKSRAIRTDGEASEPSVSSDGTTVAFVLATEAGKRLAVSRGSDAPQLLDVGREPGDPAISPDGTSVAYVTQTSGGKDVSIRRLSSTSAEVVASGSADEFDPAWSSDGTRLAYVLSGSSDDTVVIIDAASGSEVSRTTSSGHVRSPALSPTGSHVAFIGSVQGNAEVIVAEIGAAKEGTNVSQSGDTETAVVWLADGRLATAAPTRGIVTISETSPSPEPLTAAAGDSL